MKKIAIVPGKGLGDALIFRVLAHNLSQAKFEVTTFSTALFELQSWFPNAVIKPFPENERFPETFESFDKVIAFDHSILADETFPNLIFIRERDLFKKKTFVENLRLYCEKNFAPATVDTGIQIPPHLSWRKFSKRVVLHPTSTDIKRNWPKEKFLKLEALLRKEGFDPVFCVSSKERVDWQEAPLFPNLSHMAEFVYESGYMIGNNSGVGHLASVLNIPTLSLFARKSYSKLWRPGFSKKGAVVTPPNFLIGSKLKQKYWKMMLSERRVLKAFYAHIKKLGEEH